LEPAIILSGTDPDLPRRPPVGHARYTGLREMARGGNAQLKSGFDSVIGRTVAIKMLLPEQQTNAEERRRLLREARVTAQLQHPNTVPVYEIGDDDFWGVYFTMKRISGENFFEALKRIARKDEPTMRAFPISRRLETVLQICQALAYAHARGVIHRDVKPENIWVGNFGEVVLLDWGVAKVWGHPDDNQPLRQSTLAVDPNKESEAQLMTLTAGGQRPGTPLYMSPEQVDGSVASTSAAICSASVSSSTNRSPCENRSVANRSTRRSITSNTPKSRPHRSEPLTPASPRRWTRS